MTRIRLRRRIKFMIGTLGNGRISVNWFSVKSTWMDEIIEFSGQSTSSGISSMFLSKQSMTNGCSSKLLHLHKLHIRAVDGSWVLAVVVSALNLGTKETSFSPEGSANGGSLVSSPSNVSLLTGHDSSSTLAVDVRKVPEVPEVAPDVPVVPEVAPEVPGVPEFVSEDAIPAKEVRASSLGSKVNSETCWTAVERTRSSCWLEQVSMTIRATK